jgi:hypothetical protein
VAVLVTGAVAALPPPLAHEVPLKEAMAYTFNDFRIPTDDSWGFVLQNYPKGVRRVQIHDFEYFADHPLTTIAAFAGLITLYVIWRRGDPYFTLLRAAGVACLVYLALLPNYTALRLELVFLPDIAVGLALLLTVAPGALRAWAAGQRAKP